MCTVPLQDVIPLPRAWQVVLTVPVVVVWAEAPIAKIAKAIVATAILILIISSGYFAGDSRAIRLRVADTTT